MARARSKRQFGQIQKLPSGKYRARYQGPDGQRHNGPTTFSASIDAEGWLAQERRLLEREDWTPPATRKAAAHRRRALEPTFAEFSARWMDHRELAPKTRSNYKRLLAQHLGPAFGELVIPMISTALIREWQAGFKGRTPVEKARAYQLLHAILGTAVEDGIIPSNPCVIRGASSTKRSKKITIASYEEIEALADAMVDERRAMALIAAWCGPRFGEITELRRKDVDLAARLIHIRRGVVHVEGEFIIGKTKSDAGVRDVSIPPHIVPAIERHLKRHVGRGQEALLFPSKDGGHLASSSLYGRAPKGTSRGWGFYRARSEIGRPDLRWHDLRHTGATYAARAGATNADLMARMGHSTSQATMIYQHAAAERDRELAGAMSKMAVGEK